MHIVLEGPDNSGKTTLGKAIKSMAFGDCTYWHAGGPPKSLLEEGDCIKQQIDMLMETHHQFVIDRVTTISQQVYNPDEQLDHIRQAQLFCMSGLRDVVFVYCRPSTDRLLRVEDITWREEESEEHRQKIIQGLHTFVERYDTVMQRIPCVVYDYDDPASIQIRDRAVLAMRGDVDAKSWFQFMMKKRG